MPEEVHLFFPKVGLRNVKTALSASLCATVYALIERNPTFACIGAIFGMGTDMNDSWKNGGNRLIGTVIGGFLGMGLFWAYLHLPVHGQQARPFLLSFLFLGVIALILCAQIFRWPGAIQPGGVVLCIILFNTPEYTYISYALHRMVDTGFGVLLSLGVNQFLSRERLSHWYAQWHKWQEAHHGPRGHGKPPAAS